jgi:NAD(P)-dependent dehydrogenase (short-subunit alcohol dehydrogenase family)
VTEILRRGVLDGVRVAVAGAGPLGAAVARRAEELGARVGEQEELDVLVWDGAAAFAAAAGVDAVRAALDGAWAAIQPRATGPKLILLLAPPPGDAHAEAARAGLENLARTLSIEWARLGIRPVALHPGTATPAGEVAELAAFLSSPAGAYYSGCRFDLR